MGEVNPVAFAPDRSHFQRHYFHFQAYLDRATSVLATEQYRNLWYRYRGSAALCNLQALLIWVFL